MLVQLGVYCVEREIFFYIEQIHELILITKSPKCYNFKKIKSITPRTASEKGEELKKKDKSSKFFILISISKNNNFQLKTPSYSL